MHKTEQLEEFKKQFFKKREAIKENHYNKETGFSVADELRKALDEFLKPVFNVFFGKWKKPCILIALGGYGRGELNFHSDMDFNIIYKGKLTDSEKNDLENFYYFMLSLNTDLGYAPREVNEALSLSKDDLSILTNFLQMRYIAGSDNLYRTFKSKFFNFVSKNRNTIVEEIIKARNERYRKFFGTIYYQEPNIKESKGGLRDLHEAFWIAKVVFEIESYSGFIDKGIIDWKSFRDIVSAYDFLLRIRNQLHLLNNRKSDILSFQVQRDISKFFGFQKTNKGIENFMKSYFASAFDLSIITREIIKKSKEQLKKGKKTSIFAVFKKENKLSDIYYEHEGYLYIYENRETEVLNSPKYVLEGFEIVQKHGLSLSSDTFRIFKLCVETERKKFRNKNVLEKFKNIISNKTRLSYTIETMHDCKVLDALIPDFERLRGHFQFDTYHKFTTDMHLIMTVRELENIDDITPETRKFYQVLDDINDETTLFIAALLHDIGKGKRGRHENIGAVLAKKYLSSLDFPEEKIEETAWLIKNHLLMSHLAFRRDISDPTVIENFVEACKNPEKLKKLFLLTYADIKAVGPGGWDRWKSSLLWELFLSAADVFNKGKNIESLLAERVKKKAEKVENIIKDDIDRKLIEKLFNSAEKDYLRTYSAKEIVKHLKMVNSILKEKNNIFISYESFPDKGYTELTVIDKYKRAFFYKIAGVLACFNLNIKGAYINKAVTVEKTDYMAYTIRVSTVYEDLPEEETIEKATEKIIDVYNEKIQVEKLLPSLFKPKTFRKSLPKPLTKIKFDNKSSAKYTVIEVSTWDRLGLLYAITRELAKSGVKLRRALIATEGNRVIDSFYITDENLNKITDEKKITEIKEKISGKIG